MDDRSAILLVAASEHDANMFYATRFFTPDAFIYLETDEERLIVIGNLELERARSVSPVDRVLPLTTYWKMAQEKHQKAPGTEEVVDVLLRDLGLERVIVPPDFNVKFADGIRKYGHEVEVKLEPFFERRLTKEPSEIEAIQETIRHTENALREGIELIRSAEISATDMLTVDGKPLTSEMVRERIHIYLITHECLATHSVVSCGPATAVPHDEGSGPLYANQPIILDCSPRSRKNGYYADMTRTIVRGTAPVALARQFDAVLEAQDHAFGLMKPGTSGKDVHAAVSEFLSERGYKTALVDGKPQGFFHATGHGIGVDVHERPRLALRDEYLAEGNVLAVEPALYYSEVGGVRIEDDVVVTPDGAKPLTTLEKTLEI